MRIDMDRLCVLAGVKSKSSLTESRRTRRRGRSILKEDFSKVMEEEDDEGMGHSMMEEDEEDEEDEMQYEEDEMQYEEDDEGMGHSMMEEDEEDDEMVQVNEAMLVQELRRAKRIMNENRNRQRARKQRLQEMQLKGIIDQEVKNVLKELQLNSGWVYGNKKPKRSRHGYTHQGSFLKGIGFK